LEIPYANAHVERFALQVESLPQASYAAELRKAGRTFVITPERPLLANLLRVASMLK